MIYHINQNHISKNTFINDMMTVSNFNNFTFSKITFINGIRYQISPKLHFQNNYIYQLYDLSNFTKITFLCLSNNIFLHRILNGNLIHLYT